jgi:uncharacterized protein YmfQ (DUF2313 family)
MMRDDYIAQLAALLPPGPALSREADGVLMRLLGMQAGELARVEARAGALLVEADPRATEEMLPDWERVAGLPDPCLGASPTIAQRRARLVQQLTATRGQSRAFFIGVAASLGLAATVTEFRELICEMDCEQPVHDTPWVHAWRLNLPTSAVTEQTCEDSTETPLAVWGDTTIECVIRALAPAHTTVLFAYA